jgi:hypothetical protein
MTQGPVPRKVIFFLGPRGGPEVLFPLYFIRKLILLLFMMGYETDVGLRGKGVGRGVATRGRGQKGACFLAYFLSRVFFQSRFFSVAFFLSRVPGKTGNNRKKAGKTGKKRKKTGKNRKNREKTGKNRE